MLYLYKNFSKMEFAKQQVALPVENFDVIDRKKVVSRHGNLLPSSIRAIFCGPSSCGKTNALLSLITHPNGLRFVNLYVYSKSLNQPKYEFLKKVIEPLKGMQYFAYSENDDVISSDKVLPDSIIIFDDIACEKQDNMRDFFCMGRHKNVDSFYLSQTYARIPKHLVRDNANLLVLFRQDEMNLRHIYNDHVTSSDMSFARFKELCSSCWKVDYGFLVIDKDRSMDNGRYRKNFDQFAIFNEFAINMDNLSTK